MQGVLETGKQPLRLMGVGCLDQHEVYSSAVWLWSKHLKLLTSVGERVLSPATLSLAKSRKAYSEPLSKRSMVPRFCDLLLASQDVGLSKSIFITRIFRCNYSQRVPIHIAVRRAAYQGLHFLYIRPDRKRPLNTGRVWLNSCVLRLATISNCHGLLAHVFAGSETHSC